jgi:hypothetical protein
MPHLEAASILLVGPTLKKYNDRGMGHQSLAFVPVSSNSFVLMH